MLRVEGPGGKPAEGGNLLDNFTELERFFEFRALFPLQIQGLQIVDPLFHGGEAFVPAVRNQDREGAAQGLTCLTIRGARPNFC